MYRGAGPHNRLPKTSPGHPPKTAEPTGVPPPFRPAPPLPSLVPEVAPAVPPVLARRSAMPAPVNRAPPQDRAPPPATAAACAALATAHTENPRPRPRSPRAKSIVATLATAPRSPVVKTCPLPPRPSHCHTRSTPVANRACASTPHAYDAETWSRENRDPGRDSGPQ